MTTERKERPILFSPEMVRALQAGTKTQTRRIVKGIPNELQHNLDYKSNVFPRFCFTDKDQNVYHYQCPYGKPGDVLWVRETFSNLGVKYGYYMYKADDLNIADDQTREHLFLKKWKPSIHMPKIAARIWLEITDVRVERLKDIKREDAIAEGINRDHISGTKFHNYVDGTTTYNERTSFYSLWESINGKESLDANPWVWVVEFKMISKP